jgi:hypothetical protein
MALPPEDSVAVLERLADLVVYAESLTYTAPMETADVPSKELDMEQPYG